ncbi:MAG: DUF2201 family putative metallopeptidase [Spirochaetia bacterium]
MARRSAKSRKSAPESDPARAAFDEALKQLHDRALFNPMLMKAHISRQEGNLCPEGGWAVVTNNGAIHVHHSRRAEPEEWLFVIAHCLLHLALDHFKVKEDPFRWNAACDASIYSLLSSLKIGRPPSGAGMDLEAGTGSEDKLYSRFKSEGIPEECLLLGTAGKSTLDMIFEKPSRWDHVKPEEWQRLFSEGVASAAARAVRKASGDDSPDEDDYRESYAPRKARQWFIDHYPLLGALAARMRLIEDKILSARYDIRIAAVSAELQEIYINPVMALDEEEWRFVLAHEMLHVGLRHQARCQGRDPFLWNVACDYVVNGWLQEMRVGRMPAVGALYEPEFKGLSAESIYDRVVKDLRRFRKLSTLRGAGLGDILPGSRPEWWEVGEGLSLDDFYRRCLIQGLEYHAAGGRGLLPAGLVEEVRALAQPPVPWDVDMARWFDPLFPPVPKLRSYARLSRRQSATPDIPRPSWVVPNWANDARTFGVVLDTSGSMERGLLARALGAVAGTCFSRDIPVVRVVFADAAVYDQGYMKPEDLMQEVRVVGRGGTVLQPAVRLLEGAQDFPEAGPILIITDGYCDALSVRRTHAFLVPRGRRLPFAPQGPVFYIE